MISCRHLAAASLATMVITGSAHAGSIAGSDSIVVLNVATSPATDLLSTLANGGSISFRTLFWAGGGGDLAGIPSGTTIANTSLTLTAAGLASFGFTSTAGSFVGASSIQIGGSTLIPRSTGKSGSIASGSETIGLALVGTFTPAGPISRFAVNSMSVALTLNENGITGARSPNLGSFSASFSVADPAIGPGTVGGNPIPEPASVLLLASATLGLGIMRDPRAVRSTRVSKAVRVIRNLCPVGVASD